MRLVGLTSEPDNIIRNLPHFGEPTEPPPLEPTRAPLYHQNRVLRHRPSPSQQDLFDA